MAQLTFELKGAPNVIDISKFTDGGVNKVRFLLNITVGVVHNTYDGFDNGRNQITVVCNESDSGTTMDAAILTAAQTFVSTTYPPINY